MTSESRPETEQGNSAGGGPATATSVNESKPAANAKDAFIGRVLEHYRLEERLGAGGMGLLYRATDLKLKRAVAVKLLARHLVSDETAKARFVQEARAASAIDHPNIATVYDIGEEDGELFIVMALYDGETLKQRMEKGRLPVDEAVGILRSRFPQIRVAHRCACPLPKGSPLRRSSGGARRSCAGAARVRSGASAAASSSRKEPASTSPASAPGARVRGTGGERRKHARGPSRGRATPDIQGCIFRNRCRDLPGDRRGSRWREGCGHRAHSLPAFDSLLSFPGPPAHRSRVGATAR